MFGITSRNNRTSRTPRTRATKTRRTGGGLFGMRRSARNANGGGILTGDGLGTGPRTTTRQTGRRTLFGRKDPNRRAGGPQAALHNPNTTHEGRRNAKAELRAMGRGRQAHGHPSLGARIKHMFGMRQTSTRTRRRNIF